MAMDIANLGIRVVGEDGVIKIINTMEDLIGTADRVETAMAGVTQASTTTGAATAAAATKVDLLEQSVVGVWAAMQRGTGISQQTINSVTGVDRAMSSAAASAAVFQNSFDTTDATNEVHKLAMGMDKAYAGVMQYLNAQTVIDNALQHNVITQARANELIGIAEQRYLGTGDAANQMADGMRHASFAAANVTYQIQDIGVMMASGQNPFIIGIQQGSQLSQIWQGMGAGSIWSTLRVGLMSLISPVTLFTVGAIAASAALYQWMTSSEDEVATLADAMGLLETGMIDYEAAADRAAEGSTRLAQALAGGKVEADAFLTSITALERAATMEALRSSMSMLAGDLGVNKPAEASWRNGWMGGVDMSAVNLEHDFGDAGMDMAQAERLADVLKMFNDPELGPEQAIAAVADYVAVINSIWPNLEDAPKILRDAAIAGADLVEQAEELQEVDPMTAAVGRGQNENAEELRQLYADLALSEQAYALAIRNRDDVGAAAAQTAIDNFKEQIATSLETESRLGDIRDKAEGLVEIMDEIDFDGEGMARASLARFLEQLTEADGNILELNEADLTALESQFQGITDVVEGWLAALGLTRDALNQFHEAPYVNSRRVRNNQAEVETNANINEAASEGILALIRHVEGTARGAGYNTSLGNGRFLPGDQEHDLVNMTLNEVRELQDYMLAQPDNNFNSSALGAYQIVGKTLEGLINNLGLDRNQLFTPELQDALAQELISQRMNQGLTGFQEEWQGILHQGVTQRQLTTALGNSSGVAEGGEFPEVEERNDERSAMAERGLNAVLKERTAILAEAATEQEKYEQSVANADNMLNLGLITPAQHAAAVEKLNDELSVNQDRMRELDRILEQSQTPWEDIQEQIDLVTAAFNSGEIGADQYAMAMRSLNTELAELAIDQILDGAGEGAGTQFDDLKEHIDSFSGSIAGAVANSESLKDAWESIGDTIEDSLRRIAATLIQTGLENMLLGAFGLGPGGAGNPLANAMNGAIGVITGTNPASAAQPMASSVSGGIPASLSRIAVDVTGARGNLEIEEMVNRGVASGLQEFQRTEPGRVHQYNNDPRMR